ncbi:TM2 domain-containing protein [Victivallis sp. Marseille-Q1083]|uniref:TM2 domain-containing protein n=1 Tax=Victivallis sp. Marseille-Q1083 TaxID=2717288 RepID=UPI00158CAAC8|nr:TM2 domain-containing protein [Victivallis sp. Marseille-Q1083]
MKKYIVCPDCGRKSLVADNQCGQIGVCGKCFSKFFIGWRPQGQAETIVLPEYQEDGEASQAVPALRLNDGGAATVATGLETLQTNRFIVGLAAILLGAFGIHKFILGYPKAGLIMLVVTIAGGALSFGLASTAMGIIGIIEGILYITCSQEDFRQRYIVNRRAWF